MVSIVKYSSEFEISADENHIYHYEEKKQHGCSMRNLLLNELRIFNNFLNHIGIVHSGSSGTNACNIKMKSF